MVRAVLVGVVAGSVTTGMWLAFEPLLRRLTYLPPVLRNPTGRERVHRFYRYTALASGVIVFCIFFGVFAAG